MRFSIARFIIRLLLLVSVIISIFLLASTSDNLPSQISAWFEHVSSITGEYTGEIYTAPPRPVVKSTEEQVFIIKSSTNTYLFDWDQWLDLSTSDIWEVGNLDPAAFPRLSELNSMENINMPSSLSLTQYEAALVGAYYLKYKMQAPARVIQLPPIYEGTPAENPQSWKIVHKDASRNHKQYGLDIGIDTLPTPAENVTKVLLNKGDSTDFGLTIDDLIKIIPEEKFRWDPESHRHHKDEQHMINEARKRADTSGKHYSEVILEHDDLSLGNHYDWRFFRGVESPHDRSLTIQELAKAWAALADSYGIDYWLAHGATLGWWWNGLALPWDNDIDIQVPVTALHRLAWEFNGSLVIPDPSHNNRTYYLDINPWYVSRDHGNGKNVIDGRFIDTTTGSYIDITGLAYTKADSKVVQCKNNHKYDVNESLSIARTIFEGAWTYVPIEYSRYISAEYRRAKSVHFYDWRFNSHLRLWEYRETCEPEVGGNFIIDECYPTRIKLDCEFDDFQTCDEFLIEEYLGTENYTLGNAQERQLWDQIVELADSNDRLSALLADVLGLLKSRDTPMHRLSTVS